MIIKQESPDNKRRFVIHLSRGEMVMMKKSLGTEGAKWDNDKCWEAHYKIDAELRRTTITIEDILKEEAEDNSLDVF